MQVFVAKKRKQDMGSRTFGEENRTKKQQRKPKTQDIIRLSGIRKSIEGIRKSKNKKQKGVQIGVQMTRINKDNKRGEEEDQSLFIFG